MIATKKASFLIARLVFEGKTVIAVRERHACTAFLVLTCEELDMCNRPQEVLFDELKSCVFPSAFHSGMPEAGFIVEASEQTWCLQLRRGEEPLAGSSFKINRYP